MHSAFRTPHSVGWGRDVDGLPPQASLPRDGAPLPILRRGRRPHVQGVGEAGRVRRARAGARHGARPGHRHREGVGVAGPRGGRLPHGAQVVVHAEGEEEAPLSVRERGRIRAGDVQGPRDHALDAARPARGHGHRGARDPGRGGLHLHPRRVHRAAHDHGEGPRRRPVRRRVRRPQDPSAPGRGRLHLRRGDGAHELDRGKRGNPRIKPPFPAAAGVFGMPTTINNVETLAAVPPILTKGAAWYKGLSLSSPKSTGTKLFSVCGHVQQPGNYEVTMGFPLRDLVYDLCGGMRAGRTLKACIPGGSSVPILNREETEACLLDYEGVVERGSMLGSGGVIVFDDSADMVYQIMRLARFYAHESCAQCTQCREGTAWTTKILERILAGQGKPADLDLLLDLAENMTGKTICVLSDSCAAPVVSGIKKFRSEFEDYIAGRRRPVMVA